MKRLFPLMILAALVLAGCGTPAADSVVDVTPTIETPAARGVLVTIDPPIEQFDPATDNRAAKYVNDLVIPDWLPGDGPAPRYTVTMEPSYHTATCEYINYRDVTLSWIELAVTVYDTVDEEPLGQETFRGSTGGCASSVEDIRGLAQPSLRAMSAWVMDTLNGQPGLDPPGVISHLVLESDMRRMIFLPDNSRLITGSIQGYVGLWDVRSGDQLAIDEPLGAEGILGPGAVTGLNVSPAGDLVAVSWTAGDHVLFRTADLGYVQGFFSVMRAAEDMWTAQGDYIIFERGTGVRYLAPEFEESEDSGLVLPLGPFSPDQTYLLDAIGSRVCIYVAESLSKAFEECPVLGSRVEDAVFNEDGTQFAAVDEAGGVYRFETASGDPLNQVQLALDDDEEVNGISLNGETITVLTHTDTQVRVYDGSTGERRLTLTPSHDAYDAKISPDGSLIVTTQLTPVEAQLWDAASGELLASAAVANVGGIDVAVFSADGAYLATGWSGVVTVWDVAELLAGQ